MPHAAPPEDRPRRSSGVALLALAGLAVGTHIWITRSVLVPVPDTRGQDIQYLFVSTRFETFAAAVLAAWGAIAAAHVVVRRAAARRGPQPPLLTRADVGYARPLLACSASLLALLNLVPAFAAVLPVWSYLLVDLQWAWTTTVAAWVLVRAGERIGGAPVRFPAVANWAKSRKWLPEITIACVALVWTLGGTSGPRLFAGVTWGDERKYLRFCENLYQGHGFELSRLTPVSELPADFQPRVWRNVVLLGQTAPGEIRSLVADAAAFLRDPTRRFNRAENVHGFLRGKNGGDYQAHHPGLSLLMFPAYYVDRQLGHRDARPGAHWPTSLPAVSTFFFALYAFWTVLVFRLLRRVVGTNWAPWIATAALMLTLPAAAFPFQFYPEIAAGVLLFAAAGHIAFPGRAGFAASFFYGVIAGYLPWLHVRFSLVSLVLAGAAAVMLRTNPRRVVGFLTGAALPLACLGLYAYRLTGSIMPTALWHEEGASAVLAWSGAARGSVAYFLDRDWGLFAHSPVYLLALPGYWWIAQRRRSLAWLSVLVLLALLLPAAGHTLHAAGATPTRLIVAVLPFGAIPLVELLARRGRRPAVQAAFGVLFLVSLHTALAYNTYNFKHVGQLVDQSFSGWKVNLMFPEDARTPWDISTANGMLFVAWIAALAGLLVAPALSRSVAEGTSELQHRQRTSGIWSLSGATVAATLLFGFIGTSVSAATGVWQIGDYRIRPRQAAREARRLLDDSNHCAICVSSGKGRIPIHTLRADLASILQ
jgi:hypothetical protein